MHSEAITSPVGSEKDKGKPSIRAPRGNKLQEFLKNQTVKIRRVPRNQLSHGMIKIPSQNVTSNLPSIKVSSSQQHFNPNAEASKHDKDKDYLVYNKKKVQ
jgi:16S rRNA U516 pseudouridylate synthase RsuA-like enzyme